MEPDLQKKLDRIVSQLESLNNSNRLSFKGILRSFTLGIATALGATIGLAIVITLLSYLIHSLGGLPGIGRWFGELGQFLQTGKK